MAKVLVIEDEDNVRYSMVKALTKAGHQVAEANSVSGGWDRSREADFDVVLTDVNLGRESGIDLLSRLRADGFEGAIIVITAYGSVENAVQAMKLGADDYLQKPLSLQEVVMIVDRAAEDRQRRRRLRLFERLESARAGESEMIGTSRLWQQTVALAERLAAMPLPDTSKPSALPTVLILGETGAGKGVLTRHLHETAVALSGVNGPFVHVNCNALPPTLIESELFGHEKGAFTDAKSRREGYFEMAEGGTIFLDEIGDLPLELQGKLLTVVEEGTFRRVGSSVDRRARARLVAATNQNLERNVDEGRFRRDLLFRLNALTVVIPPLRERPEDALALAESMLARFGRSFGRGPLTLNEAARQAILSHSWPGNAREVVNVAQRAAMLAPEDTITPEDLGLRGGAAASAVQQAQGHSDNGRLVFDFERGVHKADDVERTLMIQALEHTGGNVSKASRLIGMQRSSFRYRIEQYGLEDEVRRIAQAYKEGRI